MLVAAENLYGKYAWERYDLLVLPAASPSAAWKSKTDIRHPPSLQATAAVSLAHELAHSWSSSANATWDDFGSTKASPYFEQASWRLCMVATSARCWAH